MNHAAAQICNFRFNAGAIFKPLPVVGGQVEATGDHLFYRRGLAVSVAARYFM